MSIATGDLVVCVNARPHPDVQPNPWVLDRLKEKAFYRVAKFFPNRGKPGLHLVGVDHSPGHGWHAWRFRKVIAADHDFVECLRMGTRTEPELEEQEP